MSFSFNCTIYKCLPHLLNFLDYLFHCLIIVHFNSEKPVFSVHWQTTAVAISSLGTLMQPMTDAGSYVARHTHDGHLLAVAVNQPNSHCTRLVFIAVPSAVITVADMHGMGMQLPVTNNPRLVQSLLILSLCYYMM